MRSLRWAILGTGHMAGIAASALADLPGAEVTAVVSRSTDRARAFVSAHAPRATTHTELSALLERTDVDIVYIATPNALHAQQAIAAARSGKHVLCEKPLGCSVDEAQRAADAAEAAGVALSVVYQTRHHPDAARVRQALGAGAIGRVKLIRGSLSFGHEELVSWRAEPRLAGAGAIHNLGVHLYDAVEHVLGTPATSCAAMVVPALGDSDRTALALFEFGDGSRGYLQVSQELPRDDVVIEILGTDGVITWTGWMAPYRTGVLTIQTPAGVETRSSAGPHVYRGLIESFAEAVRSGRVPDPSPADAVHSAALVAGILASAREGRTVDIAR